MRRTVLVTGMSGAGRTSCLKFLEDLGFDAVDNLPTRLLDRLLSLEETGLENTAIGLDVRTRDLEPRRLLQQIDALRGRTDGGSFWLLFLECDDTVLGRRFNATRRRHPLGDRPSVEAALREERSFLAPLKEGADLVIDTSELTLPALRMLLRGHFGRGEDALAISITSFSYKRGLPREADLVLDVRFLRNPHYVDELRPFTGRDVAVQTYIRADPALSGFVERLQALLASLLPSYRAEGRSYLTLAFGCTGGQHRSVYLAELIGRWLRDQGWSADVRHRDMPGAPAGDA
jgi:UPF0042 nucleotide-binding protein